MTKPTWIVTDMQGYGLCDKTDRIQEFTTERAAINRAKVHVKTTEDSEAWIYQLSHVVARPETEPTVEKVK